MFYQGPYGFSYEVELYVNTYANNGRLYIGAYDPEEGPVFDATVNLPEYHIQADEAFIKSYDENEGVLEFLMENDIVLSVVRYVPSGCVMVPLCQLNMEKIHALQQKGVVSV